MNNFTLIIPTHNRHNYISRSISYFRDLEADVIYCDSSRERYNGEIPKNIKYLHLPNKKFAEKVLFTLNEINTDFVALCADDDFIIINSLYKGANFLSENRDFKTIVGKYVTFLEDFDGHYYKLYNSFPKDINYSPNKNAMEFFSNYYQILWAMYEKNVILNSFKIIDKAQFNNDNYIEMVIGACSCYYGGVKFIDEIWGVREFNISEHWATRHISLGGIQNINTTDDYKNFKTQIDLLTFNGYADTSLNSYLKKNKPNIFRRLVNKIINDKLKINLKILLMRNQSKDIKLQPLTNGNVLLNKISEVIKQNNIN